MMFFSHFQINIENEDEFEISGNCNRATQNYLFLFLQTRFVSHDTVFLGENVIQIAKMQSSVATNLHFFSILFYNKSQKWKILATLGLF